MLRITEDPSSGSLVQCLAKNKEYLITYTNTCTYTHTHTHIYIYIYIYALFKKSTIYIIIFKKLLHVSITLIILREHTLFLAKVII